MTAHLRRQRQVATLQQVSHHTVDRLTRDLGLFGVRRGKKLRTTIPDPAAPARSPDLLGRESPPRPRSSGESRTSTTSGPGPVSC